MNWQLAASITAPVLIFLATVVGLWLKRRTDKETAKQAEAEAKAARELSERTAAAELEAKRAKEAYDQMQEDLADARKEMRGLQEDLVKAREEVGGLWRQLALLRREKEADEAHIAEWHRWARDGSQGPIPVRPATVVVP